MTAITIDRVSHHFGAVQAVNDVSLVVAPGEILCLLGPSGCGKTTLLRLVAGLETLQTGRILLGDRQVADAKRSEPAEKRRVGMVFQDQALFPHLTVGKNVEFGLNGLSKQERAGRVHAALDQVGLIGYLDRYPHTLSGGQQQRVALARALAPQPSVMLFDEPFVGLDPRLRATLRAETLSILSASGAAVLFVTHDPEEALALGDRIAILRQGRVVQIDTPQACYEHPVDREAALALGDANRFMATAQGGMVDTPVGSIGTTVADGGVEVLIRPEHLFLAAEGAPATVQSVTFLGPLTQVEVTIGGSVARLLLAHQPAPKPGEQVGIGVRGGSALVYPAA